MATHPFIAILPATYAVILGLAALLRKPRAVASWSFFGGMVVLAVESWFVHLAFSAERAEGVARWWGQSMAMEALLPGLWLAFSLSYSRGNAGDFIKRWWLVLVLAFLVPAGLVLAGGDLGYLVTASAPGEDPRVILNPSSRILNVILLLTSIFVLVNLERTFRASVGTARWRVKYLYLGVAIVFGARVYTHTQSLLYSSFTPAMGVVESATLLIGCGLMTIAYLRRGFNDLDIYPSRFVLHGSLTIILAGGYLVVVGLLAQVVSALGGIASFPAQAFIVLLGIVGLAALLLSDRFRTRLRRFVAQHFHRPVYDSQAVWSDFTRRTGRLLDRRELCQAAAKAVSETFEFLSVRVLLREGEGALYTCHASTSAGSECASEEVELASGEELVSALADSGPVVLEDLSTDWVEVLDRFCPNQFAHGGSRLLVPLLAEDHLLGIVVVGDRVDGVPVTEEERELLGCIANQLAAALFSRSLGERLVQTKELAAFQTMSTFFVHDLKNAVNSLNLMLQNLPKRFDDPEFREDAIRGMSRTVERMNEMIEKLGHLRGRLELRPAPCDLADLVHRVLDRLEPGMAPGQRLDRQITEPLPVRADEERMCSVVTNLVSNAIEALGPEGVVRVALEHGDGEVRLAVADDGAGMSPEFVREELYKPFRSTKSKGLGIGMFQSKMIVEAHGGSLQVESAEGRGSVFTATLPGVIGGEVPAEPPGAAHPAGESCSGVR